MRLERKGSQIISNWFDPAPPSPQIRRLTQAAWAFGPKIATLILGYVIGSIVLGFRPSNVS